MKSFKKRSFSTASPPWGIAAYELRAAPDSGHHGDRTSVPYYLMHRNPALGGERLPERNASRPEQHLLRSRDTSPAPLGGNRAKWNEVMRQLVESQIRRGRRRELAAAGTTRAGGKLYQTTLSIRRWKSITAIT
jgi:hypothetical protein